MKGKVVRREEGLTEVLDIVLGLLIQKNATILWHFLYNFVSERTRRPKSTVGAPSPHFDWIDECYRERIVDDSSRRSDRKHAKTNDVVEVVLLPLKTIPMPSVIHCFRTIRQPRLQEVSTSLSLSLIIRHQQISYAGNFILSQGV